MYSGARGWVVRRLERRAGITTEATVDLETLGLEAPDRVRYKPSGWRALRRALKPGDVGPDDVFLDLGSGMGRVVFQAAAYYPFRRVIGVELSPELSAVAQRNIDAARGRLRVDDVELVTADVLDYEIPDDVTVVYMCNPFRGEIFEQVAAKLATSARARPRRLRVVYFNPLEEKALLRAGFRRVRHHGGRRPGREWSRSNSVSVYEFDALG